MSMNKSVALGALFVVSLASMGCPHSREPGGSGGAGPSAKASAPKPTPPGPTPAELELASRIQKSAASLTTAEACAGVPGATIESLAACVAAGGPPAAPQGGGGGAWATAGAGGAAGAALARATSPEYKKAVEEAGARFTQAAGRAPAGSKEFADASQTLEEDLKKAAHDEMMRKAEQLAPTTSPDPGKATDPEEKKRASQAVQMLTMLLAAGCMAYTGSIQGCALGAQFLSSLFGKLDGGRVDVEQARHISEGVSALQQGTCDEQCLGKLYEDSGAKAELERGVDRELEKRLPKARQRVREGFRIFECVSKIESKGTPAVAAIQKCGVGGPAVTDAAKSISNCVEANGTPAERRRTCVEEAARCIKIQDDGKAIWGCPK